MSFNIDRIKYDDAREWIQNHPIISFVLGCDPTRINYVIDTRRLYNDDEYFVEPCRNASVIFTLLLYICGLSIMFFCFCGHVFSPYEFFVMNTLALLLHIAIIIIFKSFYCMKYREFRVRGMIWNIIFSIILSLMCIFEVCYINYAYDYYHFSQKYSEKYSSEAIKNAYWRFVQDEHTNKKAVIEKETEDIIENIKQSRKL